MIRVSYIMWYTTPIHILINYVPSLNCKMIDSKENNLLYIGENG